MDAAEATTDRYMARAMELAAGRRTHPNPTVGCVLVRDGAIVGEGFHAGPGFPHAEIEALRDAGAEAAGSLAYVTLEPCSHHGRTPPCADALIEAGVSGVVVAVMDPDDRVAGAGLARLRNAGIAVTVGISAEGAAGLDPAYVHPRRTGPALITQQVAVTLDGVSAADDGSSQWITGPAARRDGHRLRADSDAVLIGAGTLRADDPRLDVRLDGYDGRQPRPVVVAGREPLPEESRLAGRSALVIATEPRVGWETVVVPGEDGLPDPLAIARALGDAGLLSVLSEAGARLAGALWRAGATKRAILYLAPRMAGGAGRSAFTGPVPTLADLSDGSVTDTRTIGPDLRITFERT